jgi:hypothetical protein
MCTVRRIADGPAVAHAEGHIVFARVGGASAARAAGHSHRAPLARVLPSRASAGG